MNPNLVENRTCPSCGYLIDNATHVGNEQAVTRDGDLSICIQCAVVLMFSENSTVLLAVTDEAIDEIARDDPEAFRELRRIQLAVRKLNNTPADLR